MQVDEIFIWGKNERKTGEFRYFMGAYQYAKLTGQRSVGIPVENGTTFSD